MRFRDISRTLYTVNHSFDEAHQSQTCLVQFVQTAVEIAYVLGTTLWMKHCDVIAFIHVTQLST